eukprot:TRINITY_DN5730_c0_g1_i1.p1 TRINITY_DN5730_c0_g1~~TRINITY_DN5730_c0_g1_i1.p1  ORF type:complete len:1039 (+),score=440.16 TRINITY_DN5730_c0_g1_i1:98-3214(+)
MPPARGPRADPAARAPGGGAAPRGAKPRAQRSPRSPGASPRGSSGGTPRTDRTQQQRKAGGGGGAVAGKLQGALHVPPEQAAQLAADLQPAIAAGADPDELVNELEARARRHGGYGTSSAQASVFKGLYHKALAMRVDEKLRLNRELSVLRQQVGDLQERLAAERAAAVARREQDAAGRAEEHARDAAEIRTLRREVDDLRQLLDTVERERDAAYRDRETATELAGGAKSALSAHESQLADHRRAQQQREAAVSAAREEAARERERAAALEEELGQLRSELTALRRAGDEGERTAAELQQQLDRAVAERDRAQDAAATSRGLALSAQREMQEELGALEHHQRGEAQRRASELVAVEEECAALREQLAHTAAEARDHAATAREAREALDEYKELYEMKTAVHSRALAERDREHAGRFAAERQRTEELAERHVRESVPLSAHQQALAAEQHRAEERLAQAQSEAKQELEGCLAASRKLLLEAERRRSELEAALTAAQQEVSERERLAADQVAAAEAARAQDRMLLEAKLRAGEKEVARLEAELEDERERRQADFHHLTVRMEEERAAWRAAQQGDNAGWDSERQQLREQIARLEQTQAEVVRKERALWEHRIDQRDEELSAQLRAERERSRTELESLRRSAELDRRRERAEYEAERQRWELDRAQLEQRLHGAREAAAAERDAEIGRLRNELALAHKTAQALHARERDLQDCVSKYVQIIATSKDHVMEYQHLLQLTQKESDHLKLMITENKEQAVSARAALQEKRKVIGDREDALHSALIALRMRSSTVEELHAATEEQSEEVEDLRGRIAELEQAVKLQDDVLEAEQRLQQERDHMRALEADVEHTLRVRRRLRVDSEEGEVHAALRRMDQLLAATPAQLAGLSASGPGPITRSEADMEGYTDDHSSRFASGSASPQSSHVRVYGGFAHGDARAHVFAEQQQQQQQWRDAEPFDGDGRVEGPPRGAVGQWPPAMATSPPPPGIQYCPPAAAYHGAEEEEEEPESSSLPSQVRRAEALLRLGQPEEEDPARRRRHRRGD